MERFVQCSRGCHHWGAFGAAGLLLRVPGNPGPAVTADDNDDGGSDDSDDSRGGDDSGTDRGTDPNEPLYLLVLRHPRSHQGGTWALPGGALLPDETALDGALREAEEEIGPLPPDWSEPPVPVLTYVDDHGEWSYTTLVVEVVATFEPADASWETAGWQWVTASQALAMPMIAPLRAAWPTLTTAATP